MGDFDKAYSYYAKAYEHAKARDRLGQRAWARAGMAGIELRRGLDQKALDDLQNALQIADSLEDTDLAHVVHFRLGKFYESQYELDKAIQHYETAIHLSESGRNNLKAEELAIGFLSDRQEPYQRQAECYVKKYYTEKNNAHLENIFRCEELTHARVLKDEILTADSRRHLQDAELLDYNKLCDNFQILQRQLRASRKDISQKALDSLLAEIQLYKYDLISEKIRLGNLDSTQSSHMSPAKLQDVQEQLANQTAILYHVTDRSSFALVVQADTCSVVPLPLSSSAMDSLIGVVMTPLHNVEAKDVFTIPFHAAAAHILYTGLYKPIENACQLTSQILIIPSGSLAHLPFEILLTKKPSAAFYTPQVPPEYADNFLCRQYDFYYSPSTHILLRQPDQCAPGVLIVADPFKGESDLTEESFTLRLRTGWRFNPLPYAHVEASLISRFCPKSKILTQGKATEQRVLQLAPKYGILHIASHAFVDTTFDIFSGLALAEDKNNDGLLMGFEIANANFPCNLITLSACETGRGKLIHGEGVLGLPRQFLLSGSRSVIMSNWKVDDEFTADFMPLFYEYVLRDGLPKANALANAKRDVLAARDANTDFHYQHPFFWAAFNLYGDAGKMNEIPMDRSQSPHILLVSIPLIAAGFIVLALLRKKWASSGRV